MNVNVNVNVNENVNENKISFASSLTTEIPKEEVVKEVPDGWLYIRKDKEPKFLFGEITEDLMETYRIVDELENIRINNAINRTLLNYERYKEEDEEKFGSQILQSWEIDDYNKEMELNKKLERLEQEYLDENYESSEDEYITN